MKKTAVASKTPPLLRKGENYLILTPTHYYAGCIEGFETAGGQVFVTLRDASWISDTGRLSDALKSGFESQSACEIEPVGRMSVAVAFIGMAIPYSHPLPTERK